jgi:hypothetical protein
MTVRKALFILFTLTSFGVFSSSLFSMESLSHAYPRVGVRTLFENNRVFAWDVTWLRDIEQPYHRHRYDLAAVYLRYGPIRITRLDGTENPQNPPFEIPRPFFQPANVTHKEEMIGFSEDAPQRWAIMFDLKDTTGTIVEAALGTVPAFPRVGSNLAIDNERVLEWVHTWERGEGGGLMTYVRDSLQVMTAPGILQYTFPNGGSLTEAFATGETRFISAGTVRAEKVISGSPSAVTIELK